MFYLYCLKIKKRERERKPQLKNIGKINQLNIEEHYSFSMFANKFP